MKCDVSFDGKFMAYLAIGKGSGKFTSWSGVRRLPWLKTLVETETTGTNWGGGYFTDRKVLITNDWKKVSQPVDLPFTLTFAPRTCFAAENRGVLYEKFARDGFTRIGDDDWVKRPSLHHPELKVHYLGYVNGDQFAFSLEEHPDLIEGAPAPVSSSSTLSTICGEGRRPTRSMSTIRAAAAEADREC